MITVATDRMVADLQRDLARDYADTAMDALFSMRDSVASHYMLYAVKPLGGAVDRSPNAEAVRTRRRDLLAELWLHLDRLCGER